MALYKLKIEEKDRTQIYARNPQDVIDLVKYYRKREGFNVVNSRGVALVGWVKKVPTLEEITEVEKGELYFQTGAIDFSGNNDEPFFLELAVKEDFTVYLNRESLIYFELLRKELPKIKRANLYKIQSIGGITPGLTFLPEDIMQAIQKYDLKQHIKGSKKIIEKINKVKSYHPNLG